MGLEWAFDNQAIINLKGREMIFELGELNVTTPLDPREVIRYIELAKGDKIENLYKMIVRMDDYVKSTTDGALSWRSINLCTSDSKASLENWQQRMHAQISTLDWNRTM